jgi:hypothetical protein
MIRLRARKDLSVAGSDGAPALAFEGFGDHGRATASPARRHRLVYECHKLVWKADSDLNAHTEMVPKRDRSDPGLVHAWPRARSACIHTIGS